MIIKNNDKSKGINEDNNTMSDGSSQSIDSDDNGTNLDELVCPPCIVFKRKPGEKRSLELFPTKISKERVMIHDNLCCCCLLPLVTLEETYIGEEPSGIKPDTALSLALQRIEESASLHNSTLRVSNIAFGNSCRHVFHSECIQLWAKAENTCPHCKTRIFILGVYSLILHRHRFQEQIQLHKNKAEDQNVKDVDLDQLELKPLVKYLKHEETVIIRSKNLRDSLQQAYTEHPITDEDRCQICLSHHASEEMLQCSGREGGCRRRFHWMCLEYIAKPEDSVPWFCQECVDGDHCFIQGIRSNPIHIRHQQSQYMVNHAPTESAVATSSGVRLVIPVSVGSSMIGRDLVRSGVGVEEEVNLTSVASNEGHVEDSDEVLVSGEPVDNRTVVRENDAASASSVNTSGTVIDTTAATASNKRHFMTNTEVTRILMRDDIPELSSFQNLDVDADELICPPTSRMATLRREDIKTKPPPDILFQLMNSGASGSRNSRKRRKSSTTGNVNASIRAPSTSTTKIKNQPSATLAYPPSGGRLIKDSYSRMRPDIDRRSLVAFAEEQARIECKKNRGKTSGNKLPSTNEISVKRRMMLTRRLLDTADSMGTVKLSADQNNSSLREEGEVNEVESHMNSSLLSPRKLPSKSIIQTTSLQAQIQTYQTLLMMGDGSEEEHSDVILSEDSSGGGGEVGYDFTRTDRRRIGRGIKRNCFTNKITVGGTLARNSNGRSNSKSIADNLPSDITDWHSTIIPQTQSQINAGKAGTAPENENPSAGLQMTRVVSVVSETPVKRRKMQELNIVKKVFDKALAQFLKERPLFLEIKKLVSAEEIKTTAKAIMRVVGGLLLKNQTFMQQINLAGESAINEEAHEKSLWKIVMDFRGIFEGWMDEELTAARQTIKHNTICEE